MRIRSVFLLVLCLALCLSLVCTTPATAEVSSWGYIITSSPEELAPLREGPSDDAKIIASYFSGARYELGQAYVAENGYIFVFIENSDSRVGGYMREDWLAEPVFMDGVPVIEPYAQEVAVIRVPEGESAASLRDKNSSPMGNLADGTLVKLLGIGDGRYHVWVSNLLGFIDDRYIDRTGEPASYQTDITMRGYGVIRPHAYEQYGALARLPQNLNEFNAPLENYPQDGFTLSLFSADELNAQLGYSALQGFLPLDAVSLYWYKDLYVECGPVGEGDYVSGQDFPPGLYTFFIGQGQSGFIQTDINGVQREYATIGEAEYTLYLPEGMQIKIAGGTLRPKTEEPFFGKDRASTLSGCGRLFIDPENVGSTFYLTALPDASHASYAITSLLYEEGLAEPRLAGELAPGEQTGFLLYLGEFIYIENCELEAAFGSG